jgi:hypothetical protein
MKTTRLRKILVVSVLFLLTGLLTQLALADPGDPPARVARLSLVQGKVSFQPSGESQWAEATVNHPITTGDRVFVDQASRAELEVGSLTVRLAQGTDLTLANLNDQLMQLGVGQGTIRVTIYDLPPNNTVEIDTPNGALILQRPGAYRVDTAPDGNSTQVIVNTGLLQVTGGGADQAVESGHAVQLTGADQVHVAPVAMPAALDDFDQWCQARDARVQNSPSARYVPRDEPGVADLDPNGVWSEVPNVGPVWYPSAVPPGWVPYSNGQWVFIEPWGWTWVGAEPWGYAPYHYGRWAHIGVRWGWVPGPIVLHPVYAPALVAFVGGPGFAVGVGAGGFGLTAWFPLGPREPFLPWYHYGPGYFRGVNVTVVNITNLNNYRYMNRTAGVTAVRGEDFRAGAAVAGRIVRVSPEQLARAQVIPHPEVTPAREALFGARTVAAPPVHPAAGLGRTGQVARGPLEATRTPMPAAGPGGASRYGGGPPSTPFPHMVTRNAPAAGNAPYSAREPAYSSHPGRPLEPQQMSNLRAGKPAGPMQDKEVPAHPAKQPQKSESKSSSREDSHGHSH